MLSERRKTEREIGFSTRGPHRDDIQFFLNNKQAKTFASQGQIRSIVLSCKSTFKHDLEDKHNQFSVINGAVTEL